MEERAIEDKKAYHAPQLEVFGTISAMTKTYGNYGGGSGYNYDDHKKPDYDRDKCWHHCEGVS